MKDYDTYRVIGYAFIASIVLYGFSGGGNATPWIFLFFVIITFYFGADSIREKINWNEAGKPIINKNFDWLIIAVGLLAIVQILTGLTTSYFVDYCNGFFKNEKQCELQEAEERIFENYRDSSYDEREYGLW